MGTKAAAPPAASSVLQRSTLRRLVPSLLLPLGEGGVNRSFECRLRTDFRLLGARLIYDGDSLPILNVRTEISAAVGPCSFDDPSRLTGPICDHLDETGASVPE